MMGQKNSRKRSWFLLIISFLIFSLPSVLYASEFYVETNGSDSNSGTQISPFRTIKKGVTALSAGDTLFVKSGTYRESILSWKTPISNGTSWAQPITISSFPGDIVTIIPPRDHAGFWINDGQKKYLIINGFVIDGQGVAFHGVKLQDNTRYVRIQNVEIKNTKIGVLVTSCHDCPDTTPSVNNYNEFINLKVHDSTSHGIYVETSRNLLENSEFYNNAKYGAHFFRSGGNTVNSNTIRYNKFYNNTTAGLWGCGLLLSSGTDNVAYSNIVYGNFAGLCIQYRVTNSRLYNNISYNNGNYGIYVGNNAKSTMIANNTVYNIDTYGIFVGDGSRDTTVHNNIAYQNKKSNIYLEPGDQTGTITSHNLTTNPNFANALAQDFHLTQKSLAIDGGMTINLINTDFDGNDRNEGISPDIGAYEFAQTVDNSPPVTPINFHLVE